MPELVNRTALVTGASGDIGRAIAVELASQGARVVATGRDRSRLEETVAMIEQANGQGAAIAADVTREADVTEVVAFAQTRFDRVDILVNNAGVSPSGTVTDISFEEWATCLATNLTSVFLACRAVIPSMRSSGGGSIVNIAGTLGLTAMPRKAAYCAAKAGVVNLTRQMALDYGSVGIRINAVCPGFIDTRLNGSLSGEDRQFFLDKLPIPTAGESRDIASITAYLCSDQSRYITGATLPIDGGQVAGLRA